MSKLFANKFKRFNAMGMIAAGFAAIILAGSLLLSMPVSSANGKGVAWFDALFTSTSAVCVTGLITVDTGTTFSRFGHWVLLILIQLGGLGFMTFATLLFRFLGKKLTMRERMLVRESMNEERMNGLIRLIQWVAMSTFTIEFAGAALLAVRMIPQYGWRDGAFYALFHSVSAYCNAGFDLFGHFSSLTAYRTDVLVNLAVCALVVLGGLGFSTVRELCAKRSLRRIGLQAKLVLTTYGLLFLAGFGFNLLAEWSNPKTLGELSVGEKLLAALFQSVTLRTAGFNTIDQAALRPATKLVNCLLMFVGASPASTGGGVKVTTLAVLVLVVRMVARGESEISVFGRRLEQGLAQRAIAIAFLAAAIVLADVLALSLMQPNAQLIDVAYECASAMGTVGISALGTPSLNLPSKILILVTMYFGRVGPLSLAVLLASRQWKKKERLRYPEDRVMIG